MISFHTKTFTTTTKEYDMKSDDINLFKFTLNVLIVIFITWVIEINTSLERVFIGAIVSAVYLFLFVYPQE